MAAEMVAIDKDEKPIENIEPDCCPSMHTSSKNPDLDFHGAAFKNIVQLFWDRWCSFYQTSQDPVGTIRPSYFTAAPNQF
jgi:hypothetical protein